MLMLRVAEGKSEHRGRCRKQKPPQWNLDHVILSGGGSSRVWGEAGQCGSYRSRQLRLQRDGGETPTNRGRWRSTATNGTVACAQLRFTPTGCDQPQPTRRSRRLARVGDGCSAAGAVSLENRGGAAPRPVLHATPPRRPSTNSSSGRRR
jgi:hypothetical protein